MGCNFCQFMQQIKEEELVKDNNTASKNNNNNSTHNNNDLITNYSNNLKNNNINNINDNEKYILEKLSENKKKKSNFNDFNNNYKLSNELNNIQTYKNNNSKSSIINLPEMETKEIAKKIFNKLNDFRSRPIQFIDDSKKYSLENLFQKAIDIKNIENNKNFTSDNDNEMFIWNEKKYNKLLENNNDISVITKNKYNCDIFKLFLNENDKNNISTEEILFKLLVDNNKEDQEKILLKKYKHCIVTFDVFQQNRIIFFYLLYNKNNQDNNSYSSN